MKKDIDLRVNNRKISKILLFKYNLKFLTPLFEYNFLQFFF